MYTTSYNDENSGIAIPDGYGGTLLGESDASHDEQIAATASAEPKEMRGSILSGLFGTLPQKFLSGSILEGFRLGSEELLILAAAALLFFTRGGDKECAIMLVLLLFIR